MSIFDTLFGVSDANVNAARIDARAGQQALRQRSQNLSGQLGAQQYGLAAGARGQNSALALREAQRRSQMGQQAIGAESLAQESMLQQSVNQANQNAQMQANVANANIEMQNDQAFSRGLGGLISTGATAAMLMSDVRAKENVHPLYSDFADKEPTGRFSGVDFQEPEFRVMPEGPRPAPARVVVVPAAEGPIRPAPARAFPVAYRGPNEEGRAAFGLNVDRRPTTTLEQGAIERNTIDAIRNPGSQPAQYRSQLLRPGVQPEELSNPAIARHLRDRREARDVGIDPDRVSAPFVRRSGRPMPLLMGGMPQQQGPETPQSGWGVVRDFGQGLMQSDFTSKEMMKVRPSSRPVFDLSPARINRMGDHIIREQKQKRKESDERGKAFGRLRYIREGIPAMERARENARDYYAMQSDFRAKEMTADESRAALAPVQPVNYRYNPEASARMAMETGETPSQRAMVFADKRTPRDGIIAQDLQKSPAFAPSVMNTPAGLAVERDRALSTNLAATAGQAKVNEEQDSEIADLKRMVLRYMSRGA